MARGNVPKTLRWTLSRAAAEFKCGTETLQKILQQAGCVPDQGGCFSTLQIAQSLFGDLHNEKVRKERELTKRYSLENAVMEGSYLNRNELSRVLAAVADAVVSKIMSSPLPRDVKEDVLRDIAELPLKLQEVGDRQTKLRRGANGNGSED